MKKRIFFVILVLFLIFLNSVILMVSLIVLKDKFTAAKDRSLCHCLVTDWGYTGIGAEGK